MFRNLPSPRTRLRTTEVLTTPDGRTIARGAIVELEGPEVPLEEGDHIDRPGDRFRATYGGERFIFERRHLEEIK